ncbi:EAL domain-containing protein [Undibacterium fentianense]|uniref:EAL domain-containing protein n=1 Tax=Undibacterium fentianense TaxID=2828728 RepID=A0A941E4P3_9BURK|nr:EAL domain-containing protein [Undibacterium fentianense]MBR7801127.1 EAL domain-containing protein [Undibacterium fentianense]
MILSNLIRFLKNFWFTLCMLALMALSFTIYVRSEKQLDRVNERRFKSHALASELRQSSDDLTRMARTYVTTGDTLYKDFYFRILAIRDGRQARPMGYQETYWDLASSKSESINPSGQNTKGEALLDLLRLTGISNEEFVKLVEAKASSDSLALLEKQAMKLYESVGSQQLPQGERPIDLLTNKSYHQAKASIMKPIAEFHQMMENRTLKEVANAEYVALQMRYVFIIVCLSVIILLWRAYQGLHQTLGASIGQIKMHLDRLGQADFREQIEVDSGKEKSVLGLLAIAQQALSQLAKRRAEVERRNLRLTQFYNVLSQCDQAIVRSHTEQELFVQICRNILQYDGIKLAWICVADTDKNVLLPVALDGLGVEHFRSQSFSLAAEVLERPLCVRAFLDAHVHWSNDTPLTDTNLFPSAAAIPLFKNGMVYGVINLYADQNNGFDEEIRILLLELAMDLSFALNRFELEIGRQRSRKIESLRTFLLEHVNNVISLDQLFHAVVLELEALLPGSTCSILTLDPDNLHVHSGAMPSLPEFYSRAIDGLAIGEGVGSCGHAMFSGLRTVVEDIAHHPYWKDFKVIAEQANLAACWSEPIRSANNHILGAFAIYHPVPSRPEPWHLILLEMAAHFLAIAIDKHRTEGNLRKLSQAVEQSPNIIIITDTDAKIEYVNQAFVEKTGKTFAQVIGQRPSILQSGNTPLFTYEEVWDRLRRGESWQGELINRYKDGREYIELAHISPIRDASGAITNFLSLQEDITEKKRTEERIQYLAHYDVLTGLPNRVLLEEQAQLALKTAKRKGTSLSLVFFDLDHFKNINDSLGHSIGDALLVELARRLREVLREEDVVSRLGGDEFILLLSGVDELGAERVAEKLLKTVSQSYHLGQYDLNISASIGIAVYPEDGDDLETLLRNADTAMYRAKQDGRSIYRFFTPEMQARSGRHMELVNALRYALDREQLHVVYQPQISLNSGRVIGTEALLRWTHPELGTVSPAEFIPVAEETGLILSIGEWVLRTAAIQTQAWHEHGWTDLSVAVNLSAIQFRHTDLPGTVSQILRESHLDAPFLELELTEGVAMIDPLGAIAVMNDLHDRGVRMSIDDFGTGYSSLSYLKKFKVSKLKIDQSFVRDIHSDPEDKAIVSAVISMAKSLGLQTIAEGVETAEQLLFLREQFCDEVQGYHFARPLTASQFEQFMNDWQT